ncbi:short-chain dehydrogenase [Pseudomonas flexibilis]|uniref:NAD(P)-dependent dehydrogenase, short-chain alcohol dehydrogenase family n=1 Tax=Pseudomonas flexibilis TaxID=706570 RepID=A0A1N7ATK6_9PSED|nr:SDR family oxidoreductase [Pseudomonas flexibilis]KHL68138.1 short-chain dehydrogenase [Pseudomonas flexibilis]SIR42439.1 NAD(P)-dependent dehydrogenase, short-chain alcohol dehydrogenase family [Pseudomonas flexibilis]
MKIELENRLAVITGASSGIGLALCRLLLQGGARVLAFSRTPGGLGELLSVYPDQLVWQPGDVTSQEDLQGLAQRAASLGPVDFLVPCAGHVELASALDLAAQERQWAVNGAGALNTLAVLANQLATQASVVFLGSFLSRCTFAGLAGHIAGKAALMAQARNLAKEFAPLQVRINMVSPGPTATGFWEQLGLNDDELDALAEQVGRRLLPGHFLEAASVARVIVFQLSEGARGVYGQDWVVDNGYTLG